MQQQIDKKTKFNGEEPYFFSPSISKRKIVDGKTYYVRRFFTGGKDFEQTMKELAIKQTYQNMR